MIRCIFCSGNGFTTQWISHGSTERGEQRDIDCHLCEGFGHKFDSEDEKRLYCILTTEEEREGYFAQKD